MESSIDYRPKPLLTSSKHPQTSSISITHPSIPQIHRSKRAWESTHPTTTTREAYLHPPGCIPPHPSHTLLHPTIPPRGALYTHPSTHLTSSSPQTKPRNHTPTPHIVLVLPAPQKMIGSSPTGFRSPACLSQTNHTHKKKWLCGRCSRKCAG
ncbi:hypothetical protein BO86DRAFT_147434 [Aspergillus japonicus CBS 114.51]|uniref:Uncharacterized protein n=1 Tax=Aspergillus japonicus CBS 114.51 TaxID=1448312 RepID=A0A8T8WV92_ASPJA|nr:hypothetical protein BO86DRAFT_147434 [Aspergillus japonicus CBS 114.51]RAH79768.1 hypothetical protein BO86DRAFT_147434 [Aspergillus japonicus CBS 114.51]